MEIKKVGVIGAGKMGRQIALCAAIHGYTATVYEANPAVVEDARKWAEEYLAGRIAKKRMTEEEVNATKARFAVENDLKKACGDADLVVEAIFEKLEAKREVFRQLNDVVREDTILATNSSFMLSSSLADCVKNPSRVCNMHFYFPALVMKFVEVVQGEHTSEDTGRSAYEFCLSLDKKPIWMKKEISGFAGNYILASFSLNSRVLVEDGYCCFQGVDIALECGLGRKWGAYRSADQTGLNLTFTMLDNTYKRTGVKPPMYDTYKDYIDRGRLGVLAGHGFYDYEEPYTVKPYEDIPEGVTLRKIGRVAVLGTNYSGLKAALDAAKAGREAVVFDECEKKRADALAWAKAELEGDAAAEEALKHFTVTDKLEESVKGADVVVEAVEDDFDAKCKALSLLDGLMKEDATLATTSGTIPSSQFVKCVKHPNRLINLYYFYPAAIDQIVELMQGPQTDPDAILSLEQ